MWFAAALVLAVTRVYFGMTKPPESPDMMDVYKDMAHVYMGALGASWYHTREREKRMLFIWLCVIEVMVATLSRR
jgi:hypothetical protein